MPIFGSKNGYVCQLNDIKEYDRNNNNGMAWMVGFYSAAHPFGATGALVCMTLPVVDLADNNCFACRRSNSLALVPLCRNTCRERTAIHGRETRISPS